jgi:gamma-glutamyltranspeptidase/glutathione hydrolase
MRSRRQMNWGFSIGLLLTMTLTMATSARGQEAEANWKAQGDKGAVLTGSAEAADAGIEMLKAGGNAVDAAVATLLVQSVTESSLFCFGGEVPIMVYDSKRGVVEVLRGLGASPQLATAQWFNENRKGLIQGRGDVANCVVPGFLDAAITALDRYGTKSFTECAQGMRKVLRERAALTPEALAQTRQARARDFDGKKWIADHQNFLKTIERLVEAETKAGGDRLRGLRAVSDYFYRGPIAQEMDAWMVANGGLLRFSDFARHSTRVEEPLSIEFRGHTVCKCGVWTQGPVLLQTLKLMRSFEDVGLDLSGLNREGADYLHLVAETMKLSFADRDAYLADPDFVSVPIQELLADNYIKARRTLFDPMVASQTQQPGNPYKVEALLGKNPRDHVVTSGYSSDTSSCLVADQWGNVVSATPSGWGGVRAGDTGIELNSRMIGLTTWEGHPSYLVPGKRPRITLTPTMVLKAGKPVFCVSVAGGDQQDQASIQCVLNRLVFNLDAEQSVRTPRIGTDHHINWFGHLPAQLGSLTVPRQFQKEVVEELQKRGHKITVGRPAATAVVLAIDPATGAKQGAGDPGRHARAH